MKRKWINTNVTILGYSLSGIAAAKYLSDKGADCIISERREAKDDDDCQIKELENLGIKVEMGEHKKDTILGADLIVVSPGIPPHSEVIKLAKDNKIEIISEVELAYIETTKPFIAITGTNGKTTSTKLISEILTNAGLKAPACGNIGVPVISLVNEQPDYFVAELSSFQIHSSPTFKPQVGIFVNYSPDHIDWHGTEEEYYKTKANLFVTERHPAWSILNAAEDKIFRLKDYTESKQIFFGKEYGDFSIFRDKDGVFCKNNDKVEEIIKINEIPLIGEHNYMNIMGAIAVAKVVGIESEIIKKSIIGFKAPEHRLEYVETINGTKFYNDSKATNCDSSICALKAFNENKVVLIAGGKDKGTDLTGFVNEVNKHVSSVVLIGQASDRFEESLIKGGFSNIFREETLESAIDKAFSLKEGDVLFSPACASFDMFKNYEERGKVFKDYVIKKKASC